MAEMLPKPSVFVCEPWFYRCDRADRRVLCEVLAEHSHTLVSIGRKAAAVLAPGCGEDPENSGIAWLHALAAAAATGLDRRTAAGHDWPDVRDALDVAHALISASAGLDAAPESIAALGPYAELDAETRLALGDGHAYRADLLVAIALAADVATNRRDFERFLGLNKGGGIGSMSHAVHAWYGSRNTGPEGFERESVLTWSAYRRALRWAYHRIAAARRDSLPASA
ncbi:MAG TPA: hypothetical protein VF316_00950 [Polyangiaceae bacterium]